MARRPTSTHAAHQKRLCKSPSGRQFTRIQLEVPEAEDHFLGVLRLHFPVVNFEIIAYDINVLLACFYEIAYPHRESILICAGFS